MNNIPEGYDENGVRSGNGDWKEDFVQEEDLIDCYRCGDVIDKSEAVSLNAGYLCQTCANELELNI